MTAEKKPFIVRLVGGVEVDLTDLPPLTIGDKRALKTLGVDFIKFIRTFSIDRALDPDEEAKVVGFVLRKRRAETTDAEVEQIPAMTSLNIIQFILQRSAEVDDPFSTSSTSSAPPTGGASSNSGAEPTPS